jgi:chitin disaccharide deacetylase
MKTLFNYLFLFIGTTAFSQQKPARLLVRGDDMGFSHSGNEALIKCSKQGIQTAIEIIVPSPWFPEAIKLLKENPTIDVGVHLALTSEWDNVKYRPLTNCPSLINKDGYFFPFIFANKNYAGQSLNENKWNINEIEREFRAQIEMAKKYIPQVSHLSGHMGCDWLSPEVKALTKKLAIEYSLDIDLEQLGVKSVSYQGAKETSSEKMKSFAAMLDLLKPGESYLFVDHPGINTPELQAISHIGYENVAMDRQGVTDIWTSSEIKELIKKKNIQLISYADLRK